MSFETNSGGCHAPFRPPDAQLVEVPLGRYWSTLLLTPVLGLVNAAAPGSAVGTTPVDASDMAPGGCPRRGVPQGGQEGWR